MADGKVADSMRGAVPTIQIFVAAHKDVDRFDNNLFRLIQVGAADAPSRFADMDHDDEGDNISQLNPQYCELTAQYWAWKNVDADYYGFCHYRRYFDFSQGRHAENEYGEIIADRITPQAQHEYALDEESVRAVVQGCDVVTTEFKDLRRFPEKFSSPVEHYAAAPHLHAEDLDLAIRILKEMHPDYAQDADAYLSGHESCFCNMLIMRKGVFSEYCSWLFPMLDRFISEADMSRYSVEALRTPGHLGERYLNIFCIHQRRVRTAWRERQLQCVHFEHVEKRPLALEPACFDKRFGRVVPLVLAANDTYVPMMTTTLYSVVRNAPSDCALDVVVIERDITLRNQERVQRFFSRWDNVSVRFFDAAPILERYELSTSNEHISVETFYRFIVPDMFGSFDKVLYLDSDLIVTADISQIMAVDLSHKCLAAVRDVDFLGNVNMKDGERLAYARRVLGMRDPYDYFQAGVLVLNTGELRRLHTTAEWLDIASRPGFMYDDQDILNAECEGKVVFLDPAWNVMTECRDRIKNVFAFAPAEVYLDYLASRKAEKIIHYAGVEKPWSAPLCDRADDFWRYARDTPFFEDLSEMLIKIKRNKVKALIAMASSDEGARKMLDPILPMGSRRREFVKAVARKIKGR